MTLCLIFHNKLENILLEHFLFFHTNNYWRQKNPSSKMVHCRKILTTKVRGNEKFFLYSKSCQILILTTFWEIDCCATQSWYSLGKDIHLGPLSNHPLSLKHIQSSRGSTLTVYSHSNKKVAPCFENAKEWHYYVFLVLSLP